MKTILQLCADTGSDTKPYKDNGYNVILVGKDIGVENYHPERIYKNWDDVPKIPELYTRPGRPKPGLAFNYKSHAKFIPEFACFNPESDMEFRSLCSQKFAQAFYEANK